MIAAETEDLQNLLHIEKTALKRLPYAFQDRTHLHQLQHQLEEMPYRKQCIVRAEKFGSLLVVRCGTKIKYARVSESNCLVGGFVNADVQFSETIEISEIRSTKETNILQIVAKEEMKKILVILTWDFDKNMERSMFQIKYKHNDVPEK